MNKLKAEEFLTITMLGFSTIKYPINKGNCFAVNGSDGKPYKIVNFCYENLKYLLRHRHIDFPIDIMALGENVGVIHDARIPDDFYSSTFCEVCCAEELLPITQKLRHQRQEERGERIVSKGGTVMIDFSRSPKIEII